MKVVIQHNIVLHARLVVPAAQQQQARGIMMSKGWVIEATLPGRIGIYRVNPDTVEIIASHHVGGGKTGAYELHDLRHTLEEL